ncbi:TfoX/Sxy family protein [Sphingobacterium mizutaii]|uniref:TfoX/Sxy family protein n=1 Tax=Sphingobacterium mizutaii TaxID=1010 RepID=UPI00289AA5BC|nr:TfoX/Sxy family protein [Sphingobacterium mizutaii]
MAYNERLADSVRAYLAEHTELKVEEKAIFGGIAFLVDGKMCINVGEDQLMCRFDPKNTEEYNNKRGVQPMIMRGRLLDGYCYVDPEGYKSKEDFQFWMNTCLAYNPEAKVSKKKRAK